ncbi:MAG: prohibitin family protein [Cytophagales bacterium]|nr:prohibitin family protein [Cytophagales bacterium]
MYLFVIGLIILVALLASSKSSEFYHRFGRLGIGIGAGLMILGITLSTIVVIDPGKVGVKIFYGTVENDVLENGLHFVNPLITVQEFDVKTQNYTMSSVHDEGDQSGDDAIRVLSADGLEVAIDLTVLYSVIPARAPNIVKTIGSNYKSVIVRPLARTKIRDNAVFYDAVSLYSDKRDEFQARIFKDIEKDFKARGIILEQLLIRNINLPQSVKQTIESKINAEQESQKMKFILQKEMQEAERKRVEAQGISDYQNIINKSLSDKQLQYEMIKAQKELAASPNTKIIIMGGKGNMPLILSDK